jgi:hypothetical protein
MAEPVDTSRYCYIWCKQKLPVFQFLRYLAWLLQSGQILREGYFRMMAISTSKSKCAGLAIL